MTDYTPTTEEVRARYSADEFGYSAGLNEPCPEFDRWLAGVKAQAVRDYLEQRMNSPRIEATIKYLTNSAYRQGEEHV